MASRRKTAQRARKSGKSGSEGQGHEAVLLMFLHEAESHDSAYKILTRVRKGLEEKDYMTRETMLEDLNAMTPLLNQAVAEYRDKLRLVRHWKDDKDKQQFDKFHESVIQFLEKSIVRAERDLRQTNHMKFRVISLFRRRAAPASVYRRQAKPEDALEDQDVDSSMIGFMDSESESSEYADGSDDE